MNKLLIKLIKIVLATGVLLIAVYLLANEKLPEGKQSAEADQLAEKMLRAVNHEAYKKTDYIEWNFANRNQYKWNKRDKMVEVTMGETVVKLNIQQPNKSKVLVNGIEVKGAEKEAAIEKAINNFNNDSFWLVAPHKVFDSGAERRLVTLEKGNQALLVTYISGGSTPGDSYLWMLDETGLPTAYKMWVSIIPIGGLKATWESWKTAESGALFPTKHKFLFLDIDLNDVSTIQ